MAADLAQCMVVVARDDGPAMSLAVSAESGETEESASDLLVNDFRQPRIWGRSTGPKGRSRPKLSAFVLPFTGTPASGRHSKKNRGSSW